MRRTFHDFLPLSCCALTLGLTACPSTDETTFSGSFTTASDEIGTDGTTTDGGESSDSGTESGSTSDTDGDTGESTGDTDGDTGTTTTTTETDTDTGPPPETCEDGIQNQDESDVDCGGSICDKCEDGAACGGNVDCASTVCQDGVCITGCQGDVDCADLADDCNIGICNIGICEQYPANEGADCVTGEVCKQNGQCTAGACVEEDLDCSALDSDCSMGVCDPDLDECVPEAVNEGMECFDGGGCTVEAYCTMGLCEDVGGGVYFYEDFADNSQGWTLDTNWEIGPAVAGCGDPAMDHTPTDDNGIAGVTIGGCAPQVIHPYYCLTSPAFDTSGAPSLWMTYYRDLYSDYTPYMKNTLEVYDGNSWVILFETLGFPGVNDDSWQYFGYDVTAYANPAMQFRWCYNIQSGGVFARGSWNVDDVTVAQLECNVSDP